MKGAEFGPGFSWAGVAEIIHFYTEQNPEQTEYRFKRDRLRQIVTGQINRGSPTGTTDENYDVLVRFLTHPEIKFLYLEDLHEPDLPYRFAFQLMEFLRHDELSDLALPSPYLEGTYRAVIPFGQGGIRYPR
jgi:hypothetical protein